MEQQDKLLLSKREVADLLSLSPRTIDKLIKQNLLSRKCIGRRTLVTKASVDSFVRNDDQHQRNGR